MRDDNFIIAYSYFSRLDQLLEFATFLFFRNLIIAQIFIIILKLADIRFTLLNHAVPRKGAVLRIRFGSNIDRIWRN